MSNQTTVLEETLATRPAELYLASALVKSEDLLDHVVSVVKQHGASIEKSESLGQKQLYHPINKQPALFLVSVFFKAVPTTVPALEADLRKDDSIERCLVTTWRADVNQPMRTTRKIEKPLKDKDAE